MVKHLRTVWIVKVKIFWGGSSGTDSLSLENWIQARFYRGPQSIVAQAQWYGAVSSHTEVHRSIFLHQNTWRGPAALCWRRIATDKTMTCNILVNKQHPGSRPQKVKADELPAQWPHLHPLENLWAEKRNAVSEVVKAACAGTPVK